MRSWTSGNDNHEIRDDAANIQVSNHSYCRVSGWRVYSDSSAPGGPFVTPSGSVDVWLEDYSLSPMEDSSFGQYDDNVAELDEALFDSPYVLSVLSAGNDRNDSFGNASSNNTFVTYFSSDPGGIGWAGEGWYLVGNGGDTVAPPSDGNSGTGYDTLSSDQNAKNSLVVGLILDITNDPYTNSDVQLNSFSSFGPTDDGRIKPVVVGNGNSLLSSGANSDIHYYNSSGTSMSSPNVAGTSVLLIEHTTNVLGYSPRASTTRGLLIHTAFEAGNPGPDYAHGWGVVDAAAAASLISDATTPAATSHVIESEFHGMGLTWSFQTDGSQPLKATLAWSDPAGTPVGGLDNPTSMLVHDLDLWITGPDGIRHPWTLDPLAPSNPAVRTTGNHIDNVEQVLVDSPLAGEYTVHFGATGVVMNQPFALIVSGAASPTNPLVCDLNADGDCNLDDLDRLYDEIFAESTGSGDPLADIDRSGVVDNDDIREWLIVAGTNHGKVFLEGDANLDGTVGGADFTTLASHFGNSGVDPGPAEAYWRHGNFDGNGTSGLFEVGGSDFTSLAVCFGQGMVFAPSWSATTTVASSIARSTDRPGGSICSGFGRHYRVGP